MKKIFVILLACLTTIAFGASKDITKVDCTKQVNAKKNQCLKPPTSKVKAKVKKPSKVRKATVKKK